MRLRRRLLGTGALVGALLIMGVQCDQGGLVIRNQTDLPLTVRVVDPNNRLEVEVDAQDLGELGSVAYGCSDWPVAAYRPDGVEVARLEEGAACGGRIWVIEEDRAYFED